MNQVKINELINSIRSVRISYPCMACKKRNVVMPFLVEGQAKYLCRECINLVYNDWKWDEKKRALPFCVFCETHHSGTVSVTFDKKRKIWQVWKLTRPNYERKLVSEHPSFGDFILNEFNGSRHISIHKDIMKKNYFTVFISKKEEKE